MLNSKSLQINRASIYLQAVHDHGVYESRCPSMFLKSSKWRGFAERLADTRVQTEPLYILGVYN